MNNNIQENSSSSSYMDESNTSPNLSPYSKQFQSPKTDKDNNNSSGDEIMEEDECESPSKYFPPSSNQNSQQNLNNIETNDSLTYHNNHSPSMKKEKVYLKSCDQIDKFERKGLTLKVNSGSNSQKSGGEDSSSSNPTPSRYIQKRVSMLPVINGQLQKAETLTPSRRKSLPEFSLCGEKEPDYNDDNYDKLYKIYAGDAIEEDNNGNNNNDGNDSDPYKMMDDDGFDEGIEEEEEEGKNFRRDSKNPRQYIKKKTIFKDCNEEEEEAAQTPIVKGSKFDEDRYIVHKEKMENGGITPQKYLPSQQQQPSRSSFRY